MDDSTSDLPQPRGAPPVICKGHVRKVRHPRFRATTTPLLRATHHDQEAEVGEQGKVRDVVQHPCGHAVQLLPGANVSVPTGHGHTLRNGCHRTWYTKEVSMASGDKSAHTPLSIMDRKPTTIGSPRPWCSCSGGWAKEKLRHAPHALRQHSRTHVAMHRRKGAGTYR